MADNQNPSGDVTQNLGQVEIANKESLKDKPENNPTPNPAADQQPTAGKPESDPSADKTKTDKTEVREVLNQLGVSEDSPLLGAYEKGMISLSDLLATVQDKGQPNPASPPQVRKEQEKTIDSIDDLLAKVDEAGVVTGKDAHDLMKLIAKRDKETQSQTQKQQQAEKAQKCRQEVVNVFKEKHGDENLPAELQSFVEQLFVLGTDNLLADMAYQTQTPGKFFNPSYYKKFAGDTARRFEEFKNFYIEKGKQMAVGSTPESNPKVNPTAPAGSVDNPVPATRPKIDRNNLTSAVTNYLKKAQV